MSDLVGNPEDHFSLDAAQIDKIQGFVKHLINFFKKVKKFNHTDAQKIQGSAMAQWYSITPMSAGLGVRNLPPPCSVLEQDTKSLLPESTGNTQEALAPSRHE